MANNQFSLKNATVQQHGLAPVGVMQPGAPGASPADAGLSSSSFVLALNAASVDIRLLITAIDSLKLTLSSQRSLPLAFAGSAKAEAKAPDKAAGGLQAPDLFKSAMAMDAALADLGRVVSLPGNEREELAQDNFRMASYPGIAAGGTTAVDLAKLEYAAAKAGIENDKGASRRQTLTAFGGDAALMATAFKMPGKDAGDMLAGWRTSMKLDRNQALDLADATNHLGKRPGDAEAADIGVILQRHGAAATAVGLAPEQAAALTAALLNTGTQKADAGAALKGITAVLGKGEPKSQAQQAALQRLNIDPLKLEGAGALTDLLKALQAPGLSSQERSTLAGALFGSADEAALRLAQQLPEVQKALAQVADKQQYATSELGDKGSVRQSASAQANTFDARLNRMNTAFGSALAPVAEGAMVPIGGVVDGLSSLATEFPKIAAGLALAGAAIAPVVGRLLKSVLDEVFTQVAKKLLSLAAPSLPSSIGKLFGEGGACCGGPPGGGGTRGQNRQERRRQERQAKKEQQKKQAYAAKPAPKNTSATAPRAGLMSRIGRGLRGSFAVVRSVSGRVASRPLNLLRAGLNVFRGVRNRDPGAIGSGLGTLGGSWAGGASGAALGAALGSVVAILGTAVGGLVGGAIGGWLGGEALGRLGGEAGNRLKSPDEVSKNLAASSASSQQVTFAPVVNIYGQDQATSRQLVDMVIQQMQMQVMPLMMSNPLAVRRGAALTDGVM
ncbi:MULTISPECIES: phage tail tape measure protein [unclassified Pseudomonas]|uniref:phage tail tape measure protein n=1 Tax=unclassified Pseudomonas TaxID=196821 RepID=UPI000C886F76|nr:MULTISPECIES: phage tail tape measure protein [unclassified Pseudomonas]PMY67935.1 phage tail tape measure protein [Pseudomonas sp. FW305-25]PMY72427.1 phage tail tape measure protein [Pseudomonas sp. FW126-L8]PNA80618.1 phage tail tape measure protein [Pseudomonas sp. FW305-76]